MTTSNPLTITIPIATPLSDNSITVNYEYYEKTLPNIKSTQSLIGEMLLLQE